MTLEKIWTILGPLVGVTLGWFLNEMSFWFRSKREDKKKIKEVLYNLIETYHTLYTGNPEPLIEMFSKKIAEKFSIQKEEDKTALKTILKPVIEEYLKQLLPIEKLKEIKERYEKAVNSLASTEPLLAYHISGRPDIFEFIDNYESYTISLAKKHFGDFSDTNNIDNSQKHLTGIKNVLINKIFDIFEKDINSVAWKINPIVWYKTRGAIKFIKKDKIKKGEEFVEELFATIPKEAFIEKKD